MKRGKLFAPLLACSLFCVPIFAQDSNPEDIPEGQEFLIQGSSAQSHLNVTKPGFRNSGVIRMESRDSSYTSALTLSDGALTNSPTGAIEIRRGSGGARSITGDIINQGVINDDYTLTLDKAGGRYWNHGQWNVAPGASFFINGADKPEFIQAAGALNISGGVQFNGILFNYLDGQITGTVYLANGDLSLGPESAGAANFIMHGGESRLLSDVQPGQSIWLRGGSALGSSVLNAPQDFNNYGTIRIASVDSSYSSSLTVDGLLTNSGFIHFDSGTGGSRAFSGDLLNLNHLLVDQTTSFTQPNGQYRNRGLLEIAANRSVSISGPNQLFRQESGTLRIDGGFSLADANFEYAGGDILGWAYLVNSRLAFLGAPAGQAGFVVTGGNARFSGNIQPNQTVWIRGASHANAAILTSEQDIENRGLIRIESIDSSYESSLRLSSGTLRNTSSGVITIGAGTGGQRFMSAHLVNQGLFEVDRSLTLSRVDGRYENRGRMTISPNRSVTISGQNQKFIQSAGTLEINGGLDVYDAAFELNGGLMTGSPYIANSSLQISPAATQPAAFVITGSGSRFSGRIQDGQSIWIRGASHLGSTRVVANQGFENAGTIRVASINSSYESSFKVDGVLTNLPTGVISVEPGTGGARALDADLLNLGLVDISRSTSFDRFNGHYENRGQLDIATGHTLFMFGADKTFTQRDGVLNVDGGFDFRDGRFNFLGGAVDGWVSMVNGRLHIDNPTSGTGNFAVGGQPQVSGAAREGDTLWIRGSSFTGSTTASLPSGLYNGGLIRLESIDSSYGTALTAAGVLTNGFTGRIEINRGSSGPRQISADIVNEGAFLVNQPLQLNKEGGAFVNYGNVSIAANVSMSGQSGFAQRGGRASVTGALDPAGPVLISGGELTGTGSVISDVYLDGILSPGSPIGGLTIDGALTLEPSAITSLELAGPAQGSEYDWVRVIGGATLDGILQARLANNFTPSAGQSFTILTAASVLGNFSNFNLPALAAGQVWTVEKTETSIILRVVESSSTPGTLAGRVTDQQGAGVPEAIVSAHQAAPESANTSIVAATTSATGHYSLSLPTGTWQVSVHPSSGLYDAPPTQSVPVPAGGATANFVLAPFSGALFEVTVSANPAGAGTVSGDGSFRDGALATVSAAPQTQEQPWRFLSWTEDGIFQTSQPDYEFSVHRNRRLQANFELPKYSISATAEPSAAGSITGAGAYIHGSTVTLRASSYFGFQFERWLEGETELGAAPNLSFTATSDRQITAVFSTSRPPDLVITEIDAPETLRLGEPLHLTFTVTNTGEEPTASTWRASFATRTNLLEGTAVTIGSASFTQPIPGGGSLVLTQSLILPSNLTGAYHIGVMADSSNDIQESDETNNSHFAEALTTVLAPDLIVENVTAPPSAEFGGPIQVTAIIRNQGTAPATIAWDDQVELVHSSGARILARNSAAAELPLAPTAGYTRAFNVTLPLESTLSPGAYTVVVRTDSRNAVAEQIEDNNHRPSAQIQLSFPPLPDLAVTAIIAPAIALPGSEIDLVWTLSNTGTAAAAGPWTETILLSNDDTIGADMTLANIEITSPLAAGASVTRTNRVTVPRSFSGAAHWIVHAGAQGQIVDANQSNNVAISETATSIPAKLTLVLPFDSVREDRDPAIFRARLQRSGSVTEALTATLQSSDPNEISVPESVTLPAGVDAIEIELSVLSDGLVDGPKPVVITAAAEGVGEGTAALTVIDVDRAQLSLEVGAPSITEGLTLSATVARSVTSTNDVEIQIASSDLRLTAPSLVLIPANTNRATFALLAPDDSVMSPPFTANVTATAAEHDPASAQVAIIDNDDPALSLRLDLDLISENGGALATSGSITRGNVTAQPLVVQLRVSDTAEIAVIPSIVIPGGASSATFYISAVNDTLVDGPKEVTLSAYVADPLTGTLVSQTASAHLTVTDDDAPALSVILAGTLAREGRDPALSGVVRRNGAGEQALTVQLTSSDTGEATVPASVVIPAGADSVAFNVTTIADGQIDGNQRVTISASAAEFSSGAASLTVTDSELPDLVVRDIVIPASGQTKANATVQFTVANQGFNAVTTTFVNRVYVSKDPILDSRDPLWAESPVNGQLQPGQSLTLSLTGFLPAETGAYRFFVVTDATKSVTETVEDNNTGASAQTVSVEAAYTATVQTDITVAPAGSSVPLDGAAVRGDGSPAAFEPVTIHIEVQGQRRKIAAITDAQGLFQTSFEPLMGESGAYTIGATHPGEASFEIQDSFSLLGLRFEPNYLVQKILPGVTVTNRVTLKNTSDQPLVGFAANIGAIESLDVVVSLPESIPAGETAEIVITASAPEPRDAIGRYLVIVQSLEGAVAELTIDYAVELPVPRLIAHPHRLERGMVRDQQTLIEFEITNAGGAPTGPMDITLPGTSWLKSVTTSPMPSLAPGGKAIVTLQLTPDSSLTLGEYDGRIAIGNSDIAVGVPFVFRHVSEAKGDAIFSVVDELTFYGENNPKVSGASVTLRDVYTSEIMFSGVTGANGLVTLSSIPEGPYNLEVTAAKHDNWRETITIKPGTLSEFTAFLRTQLVRYNWIVEEIDIEERAKIRLETTFETTVPVPVITIEPGVIDLTGIDEEEVQFEITVTNHGLIAAQEVDLQFAAGSKWSVHPLTDQIGVIPAKSSITLPLVFRRIDAGIQERQSSGSGCSPPTAGIGWKVICGQFGVSYWAPVAVVDLGLCPPQKSVTTSTTSFYIPTPLPPPPPSPVGGTGRPFGVVHVGWGQRSYATYEKPEECNCDQQGFVEKCVQSGELGFKAEVGNYAKEAINLALQSLAWTRVLGVELKFHGQGKLCTCCEEVDGQTVRGLKAEADIGADLEAKLFIGPSLHFKKSVNVPRLSEATAEFFIGAGAEATAYGSVKLSGKTKCLLTDPEACFEGKIGFKSPIGLKGNVKIEGKTADGTVVGGGGEAFGGIEVGFNAGFNICYDKTGLKGKVFGCNDAIIAKAEAEVSIRGSGEEDDDGYFYEKIGVSYDLTEAICLERVFGEQSTMSEAEIVSRMLGQGSPDLLGAQVSGRSTLSIDSASTGRELSDALLAALPNEPVEPSGEVVFESEVRELIDATDYSEPAPRERQAAEEGICAQVRLELEQEAVVTRKAIRATLEIINESEDTRLENIGVAIHIYDDLGQLATDRFVILEPELTELQIQGTAPGDRLILGNGVPMRLAAATTGSIRWTILPKDEAAPAESTRYFVGGYLSYTADGVPNTAELVPAPVTVHPNAKLALKYFHQRDVFSDDPFTPQTEPSIPFVLGVMAHNKGAGLARNMSITSAQPKIIDNIKGLLIDFAIIASDVDGEPLSPSLSIDFGDIGPGEVRIGRWLLQSTLQGLFVDYKATLEHQDIFGERGVSVFEGVEIHELIHQVEALGDFADSKPDFLVNDISDDEDLPDTLHLSDATVAPVDVIRLGTVDGAASNSDLEVQLTVAMPSGWAYVRIPDPGAGQFPLIGVRREDGVELPVGANAWLTDRTFIGQGKRPRLENTLHLFDRGGTGVYTLTYGRDERVPDTLAPDSAVQALSATSPAEIPVRWTGDDGSNGSGVAAYDIYVSTDGGPFVKWLDRTKNNSGFYPGASGRQYAFYSVAYDMAGNVEPPPGTPDTATAATGNSAPQIDPVPDITIDEGSQVQTVITARDADLPGDALTFGLVNPPAGAQIDATTGALTWPTSESDGPSTHQLLVRVTDNGNPSMSSERTVRVVVREVNQKPSLALPTASASVVEGHLLTLTVTATDADTPKNPLRFTLLAGAPTGAAIDPVTGVFQWTPAEAQGGATYSVPVSVSDNGTPALTDSTAFVVTVTKTNSAPTIGAIDNRTVYEGDEIEIALDIRDGDTPAQTLTTTLAAGAHPDARLSADSALFEWQPNAEAAGATHDFTILVNDDAQPQFNASQPFSVTVKPLKFGLNLPRRLSNGDVQFRVKAETGKSYILEASQDLSQWTDLGNFAAEETYFDIFDESSRSFAYRFFRLKEE